MLYRRLYFVLPDPAHTRDVVKDLEGLGVRPAQMHTLAREDIDLGDLPEASALQRVDMARDLERLLWNGNLGLFFVALAVLSGAVLTGLDAWVPALMALIMLATFLLGVHFASKVPKVHLDEFREALRHGEVLLMVDVPRWRVAEIEGQVGRHHPEAIAGGGCWAIEALKI